MGLLVTALMLIVAVLVSNFVSKLIPAVATPLVQIALGMGLALVLPGFGDFELPTSLFMAVFVAPLIYSDSRAIDRVRAWHSRRTILKLAIGLVVANTLVVGYLMGTIVLPLPVAAAFVLGAALSPTDPVSVSALAATSNITKRQRAILSAESIVNDATGVVVFNLALTTLITGSFSLVDAGASFLWLFFGGIALGIVLGVAGNLITGTVRRLGCDDVVFHVLFDVAVPFVTFLAGEVVGVSSIMAVMVCALVFKIGVGKAGPDESRVNIVSSSVWNVLSFAINGIVFVMLGFQLKASIQDILSTGISGTELALASVLLVVLLMGLRFAWITGMEFLTRRRLRRHLDSLAQPDLTSAEVVLPTASNRDVVRGSAVLTFAGGTKGAITLSIALSIPYSIAARSLVIFLVSVAIIVSIVLANVLVPVLAPAPKSSRDEELDKVRRAKLKILRSVVSRLSADAESGDEMATRLVISDYNRRISSIRAGLEDTEPVTSRRAVRVLALRLEAACVSELMELGEVSEPAGYAYLNRLARLMRALDTKSRASWLFERNLRRARGIVRSTVGLLHERLLELVNREPDDDDDDSEQPSSSGVATNRELQLICAQYVVEHLGEEVGASTYPIEDVTQVILEYQRTIERLEAASPSVTTIARRENKRQEIQLRGVNYELEGIQDAFDAGTISRDVARKLRDDAYLMRLDLEDMVS